MGAAGPRQAAPDRLHHQPRPGSGPGAGGTAGRRVRCRTPLCSLALYCGVQVQCRPAAALLRREPAAGAEHGEAGQHHQHRQHCHHPPQQVFKHSGQAQVLQYLQLATDTIVITRLSVLESEEVSSEDQVETQGIDKEFQSEYFTQPEQQSRQASIKRALSF